MSTFNPLLLALCLPFSQLAHGQIVVTEASTSDWLNGTLDSLDASSDILKLKTDRTHQFSFTNCGQTGQSGPSQAGCNTAYTGTQLTGTVTVNAGIQEWVTPEAGVYRILAAGAGHNSDTLIQGAIVRAELELARSAGLKVLVGQMGNAPRGGNGGTFVTYADNTPLIIAGGAGGMRGYVDAANRGSTNTSGQSLSGPGCSAEGGSAGEGGQALGGGSCSGAGGGLLSNGQGCGGGLSFINGGTGGSSTFPGGFGGGAGVSGSSSPGGGGGYSGGGVHYTGGGSSCAGGGGSFIAAGGRHAVTSDGFYANSNTFSGDVVEPLNGWQIGHGSVVMDATEYVTIGDRLSPEHDISTPATPHYSSSVEWRADVFTGTSLTVETRLSMNGGGAWSGWSTVPASGSPIPGLVTGTDMSNARVQTRMTFATTALFASPMVDSLIITVLNSATAGIADHRNGPGRFNVYPNPFEGGFRVGYDLSRQSSVGWRLVSMHGQSLLVTEEAVQPAGGHVREFDLSGLQLAPGMYWMEMTTDGQTVREKLVRF